MSMEYFTANVEYFTIYGYGLIVLISAPSISYQSRHPEVVRHLIKILCALLLIGIHICILLVPLMLYTTSLKPEPVHGLFFSVPVRELLGE